MTRNVRYIKRAPAQWWVLRQGDVRGAGGYHSVDEALGAACRSLASTGGDVVVLNDEGKTTLSLTVFKEDEG